MAHIAGIIAAGLHPSPIEHADCITSTTQKTLCGPRGGFILSKNNHSAVINRAVMPGIQGGPLMQQIAAKAVCFEQAHSSIFKKYQAQVLSNARVMATTFTTLGYRVVSGGTDNHLFMVDLSPQKITGAEAEKTVEQVGITLNRNCIPFDTQSPMIGSGIRIGTAAMTTRGMQEKDFLRLVEFIHEILQNRSNKTHLITLAKEIKRFALEFPLPS